MPELPEVECVVRELAGLVTGRRVDRVWVGLPKLVPTGPHRLTRLLAGAQVLGVARQGKRIVISLSGGRFLVVHLKMTGRFLWPETAEDLPRHVHAILFFKDGTRLLYQDTRQFGYLLGFEEAEFESWQQAQGVGPDPLMISAAEFVERLRARRGRIKPLLLNQRFLGGLGNIYVDETLFAAGIHPLAPADALDKKAASKLLREMKTILVEAIACGGSTVSDYLTPSRRRGSYQERHRVYGRAGEPCPVCGAEIERMVVGGRGTYFCPVCQPADPRRSSRPRRRR
jgi:formamidopyrimidine-DNA glycosylase